jgi:hypothetical protein
MSLYSPKMASTSASQSAPSYRVFYGTFIQLPNTSLSNREKTSPLSLVINHGVLWVSTHTGCIAGFDWNVSSEDQLISWIRNRNWTLLPDIGTGSDHFHPDIDGLATLDDNTSTTDPAAATTTAAAADAAAAAATLTTSADVTVRLVKANLKKNAFFFPGFIGQDFFPTFFFCYIALLYIYIYIYVENSLIP